MNPYRLAYLLVVLEAAVEAAAVGGWLLANHQPYSAAALLIGAGIFVLGGLHRKGQP